MFRLAGTTHVQRCAVQGMGLVKRLNVPFVMLPIEKSAWGMKQRYTSPLTSILKNSSPVRHSVPKS